MTTTKCLRCQRLCQPGEPDPNARPFRARADFGLCPDCVVCCFLHNEPMIGSIKRLGGPKLFLTADAEPTKQQFVMMMQVGGAQLTPAEINWEAVVANWDLPFPNRKGLKPENVE